MDPQVFFFLLNTNLLVIHNFSSFQAAKCFEVKIQETKEIYTSGVQQMNEFANSLQRKSFSDLEEMKLMFSSHALALGNV